jgi:SAM-dependent methyltransferase
MMFGTRDSFVYFVCDACGCVQIRGIPADLGRYYPAGYYSLGAPRREGRLKRLLQRRRAAHRLERPNVIGGLMTLRFGVPPAVEYLERGGIRRGHAVLDIGCGSGELLLAMRSYGFQSLTGIDPFLGRDIDYGNGVRVLKQTIEDHRGRYDFIMLHHVFEHMERPLDVLGHVRRLLNDGGAVLIRIPLASSEAFETYGADWVQLDAPRHLHLHTRASFERLAEASGFDVVDVVYDSTAFQFWGSEQYRRDVPLFDARSYRVNPAASLFDPAQIAAFEERARRLNEQSRGDQACFYLRASAG